MVGREVLGSKFYQLILAPAFNHVANDKIERFKDGKIDRLSNHLLI